MINYAQNFAQCLKKSKSSSLDSQISHYRGLNMPLPSKNNNPFALIQAVPSKWRGLVGKLPSGFLVFDTPVNGARAGIINLFNTYLFKGRDTIEKIIPIYAPAGHGSNSPKDYINGLVKITGLHSSEKITTKEQIESLCRGIVQFEEGKFWLSEKDFQNAFKLAADHVKFPY